MKKIREHLIPSQAQLKDALVQLDALGKDAILFAVNEEQQLVGALTDGDVRRALLKGVTINDPIQTVYQSKPKFIRKGEHDLKKIIAFREGHFQILPVLDKDDRVVNVINLSEMRSYLPIDAIIMAGGRGERLKPLTNTTPKPLLKIGDKPIMEHNVDRLALYGIDDFWISVNYLGEQIADYFGSGSLKNIQIEYLWENQPLGTIGAVSQITNLTHDYVLITNSDILTNLDYEHFYLDFIDQDADFSVVTIPYQVRIPYAVLESQDKAIVSFKEKPTYTYYSNGGIYLMKKSMLDFIPKNTFYNATDLMEQLIQSGKKVVSYPLAGYWLDVGNPEDFNKAQHDITQIKF
jgi:dTDP-glucose pyrophosphorylase